MSRSSKAIFSGLCLEPFCWSGSRERSDVAGGEGGVRMRGQGAKGRFTEFGFINLGIN